MLTAEHLQHQLRIAIEVKSNTGKLPENIILQKSC